ncbi:MAG: (2Fe-2S)-binding protein [Chloroflexota bacterium]
MHRITLTVNGRRRTAEVEDRTLLVELLREGLRLTGAHIGCDTAQCGACTVLLDGHAVKSCSVLAVQADGRRVTTVEGLAKGKRLHPVQAALKAEHGLQCGFCTPGLVLGLVDLLVEQPDPTTEQVRAALDGHLCRCTGYQHIVDAALTAAKALRETGAREGPEPALRELG